MTSSKNKLLVKSGLVMILTFLIAIFFQYKIQPGNSRWFLLLVPAIGLIINNVSFLLVSGKSLSKNYGTLISLLFGIKFFSYLLLALIYFIIEKENSERLIFISFIFVVYILNTIILLKEILNYQKSVSENDVISK